mgnify:CR=1 FL=1
MKMYLGDIYTISVNLAGLPGMSVPVGKDSKGLPVGMQLIGNVFDEKTLIRAAYTYECATKKCMRFLHRSDGQRKRRYSNHGKAV